MTQPKFHPDLPMKDNGRATIVAINDGETEGAVPGWYFIRNYQLEHQLRDAIADFIAYAWAHPSEAFYIRDEFGPAPRAAMFFALAPYRNCYFPDAWRPYIADARAYIETYHG